MNKSLLPGWRTVALVVLCLIPLWLGNAPDAAAADQLQFNRDIRPILADKCFYCHGQDANKRQGDLRLDERAAALKAKAIVPGDPQASRLIERIHSTDADTLMPPPDSNRTLSAEQKKLLERWIAEGAGNKGVRFYVSRGRGG